MIEYEVELKYGSDRLIHYSTEDKHIGRKVQVSYYSMRYTLVIQDILSTLTQALVNSLTVPDATRDGQSTRNGQPPGTVNTFTISKVKGTSGSGFTVRKTLKHAFSWDAETLTQA